MALILSGTDGLSDIDGSAATPAIRGTDANTGIFFGADIIGFSEGGTEVARFNADSQFVAAAGTAALPVVTTTGDTNTGIFFPAADTIAFSEGGVEAMRLDASGNLGLGVTPSAWASFTALQIGETGCVASNAFSTTNTQTYLGNNVYYNAGFKYIATGSAAAMYNIAANEHRWSNAAIGTAGNAITFTEAMTLDSAGNLLVGKTATNLAVVGVESKPNGYAVFTMASSTNSLDTLNVYSSTAANYRFYVGLAGTVFATNTAITAISDQRLKENIRDLDDGLNVVLALKPRKFDWKEGKGADIKNARGFIAQEFEQVLPDMIDIWKDPAPEGEEPYKAVNANLIPTLVKAIQEQQALITQLQADVAALKVN